MIKFFKAGDLVVGEGFSCFVFKKLIQLWFLPSEAFALPEDSLIGFDLGFKAADEGVEGFEIDLGLLSAKTNSLATLGLALWVGAMFQSFIWNISSIFNV